MDHGHRDVEYSTAEEMEEHQAYLIEELKENYRIKKIIAEDPDNESGFTDGEIENNAKEREKLTTELMELYPDDAPQIIAGLKE